MNNNADAAVVAKIAQIVQERGWTQEHFARLANLNRLTVRRVLQQDDCRLRPATISACARALGITVHDLRTQSVDTLLARLRLHDRTASQQSLHALLEQATQPELLAWIERHPERARQLSVAELDELFSLQGTGGPLTALGVEHFVGIIERKRRLSQKIDAIAGTHYLDLLEQLVDLLYEKIQPYRDRTLQ